MKVAIGTLDIGDEERRAIRRLLEPHGTSRPATRDQTRKYLQDVIHSRLWEITQGAQGVAPPPQLEHNPSGGYRPPYLSASSEDETGHHADDCHDPDCPMHGVAAMPWLWTEDF